MTFKKGYSIKANIAREYVAKFPNHSNYSLAKLMYEENHPLWSSPETARSAIRYVKGAHGARNRKYINPESIKHTPAMNQYRVSLPQEELNDFEPFKVTGSRIGVISDIHFPYQKNSIIQKWVDGCIEREVNTIILNGDILDCYQLSRFQRDPRKRNFKQELDIGQNFFKDLRAQFPKANIYYKLGNHEERYQAFLQVRAPELIGIPEFEFKYLLKCVDHNIHVIENKRIIKAGSLNIVHGHEFGKSIFSPVNPARGYFLRAKDNVLAGHNHQTSEHQESNLSRKQHGAWSTGCACDLHPEYMPINKWNWGYAFVNVEKDGTFEVDNIKILRERVSN